MMLVEHAKSAWRWYSVQAQVVQMAVAASWLAVPDDMRMAVPGAYLAAAAIVLAVLGIAGRLIKQDAPE